MNKITTIGLDLAKTIFHIVCLDAQGQVVRQQRLTRARLLPTLAQIPPCRVGMEACAGAHYWARQIQALGHQVRLLPPQHVKPYVRGNKNDFNDALAIAEAMTRPGMHAVAVKTPAQQDLQALHRLRERRLQERTALCNQLRGLLAEYGLIFPKGVTTLRRRLPEVLEDGANGLSGWLRRLLAQSYQQLLELDGHIAFYTQEVTRYSRQEEACQRLQTIPGFGPVVASVFQAAVGAGQAYRRGRDVAAALGLVPRQHSTGGQTVLLGISKRGDSYLRSLLVQAAKAVLRQAHRKHDQLSRWATRLKVKRGANKAAVALANKLARIGWAVLRHQTVYQPVA